MKKKFLSIILAIFLLIPCAFTLIACTPTDPEGDWQKKWKINEQTWKSAVVTDYFTVYNEDFSNRLGQYALVYSNNVYYLRTLNDETDGIYAKQTIDNNATYAKFDYYDLEQSESIAENVYNDNIQDYINALNFIKNNRTKFTFDNTDYYYNLDGTEQELSALQQKIGLQQIRFGLYYLTDGSGRQEIQARLNCGDAWLAIYFNTVALRSTHGNVLSCVFKNALLCMNNFTLTGGPSVTDVDYCEIKVTAQGLYAYYPNKGTSQSDKERYAKDNGDDTYTDYIPDNDDGWTTSTISAYNFEQLKEEIVNVYFGEFESKASIFECKGSKLVCADGYTYEIGKYTYSYYNFEILINENSEMISMTWNMKIHDNSINADSLEYDLTLTVGNANIQFPNA